ncbi:MAG: hypothetical protein H7A46_08405 [Verrucomicrobiales bacterium]|nr:hypothetical protein [Verrucomicrobiales bacterium]
MRCSFSLALAGLLSAAAIAADATPVLVEIDGLKAHPTRILARYADAQGLASSATQATLRGLGLTTRRQVGLVPGGVVLELDSPVALSASGEPDPVAQAERLLSRIEILRASGSSATSSPTGMRTGS